MRQWFKKVLGKMLWLRFWPVVLITCPLLLIPGFILLSISDAYRLKQVQGYPPRSFGEMGTNRLKQVIGLLSPNWIPVENSQVPVIELSVSESSIDELNSNLPLSGFDEKRATIRVAGGYKKVKIRYRGDNSYHWFYPKRSWRLKFSKSSPLEIGRKLALVNPKDGQFIIQHVDQLIANEFDLMSSPVTMAALKVNGKYHGLYSMIAPIDEGLIRDLQFMPGNTFMGDPSLRYGVSGIFCEDPYIWTLESVYNAPPPWEAPPLVQLIEQINTKSYWRQGFRLFDEAYMARFCAFVSLIGSYHYDSVHNLCLFLDPLAGNFRMVEWDSIGLSTFQRKPEWSDFSIASNEMFEELLRHPEFNFEKNKYLYEKLNDTDFIEQLRQQIETARDRYRDYVNNDKFDWSGYNYASPGTFDASVDELQSFIRDRIAWLNARLNDASIEYIYNDGLLKLDANGHSPSGNVRLRFNNPVPNSLSISRVFDGKSGRPIPFVRLSSDTIEILDPLYPGGVAIHNPEKPGHHMSPARLAYVYRLDGIGDAVIEQVAAQNLITGIASTVSRGDRWTTPSCDSIHPWALPLATETVETVIDDQVLHLKKDWVIPKNENVTISPGTLVRLSPGVSILSYGKLTFLGTEKQPIIVERSVANEPWGVIAVNGSSANGSKFAHVKFRGGSAENINNTHYSGMVSAYNAKDVCFDFCHFDENLIGDDMLRGAKSSIDVNDCEFHNANGDAIDFDYSSGLIQRNQFTNTGNDAIDLMSSRPIIRDNHIHGAGDKGVSIGERSSPIIFNNEILNANIGIEIKDGSDPIVVNCHIKNCKVGINGYAKNWRYNDGGHGRVYNSVLDRCATAITMDPKSDIQIFNTAMLGQSEPYVESSHVAMIDCQWGESSSVMIKPALTVYSLLGLKAASRVGLESTDQPIQLASNLFDYQFREDLTTDIHGWEVSQFGIARKSERLLRVRSKGGSPMSLSKSFDQPVNGGRVFALEARANQSVEVQIQFIGRESNVQKSIQLSPQFVRSLVPIPSVDLQRIDIRLPGKPTVEIRRIELMGTPSQVKNKRAVN